MRPNGDLQDPDWQGKKTSSSSWAPIGIPPLKGAHASGKAEKLTGLPFGPLDVQILYYNYCLFKDDV